MGVGAGTTGDMGLGLGCPVIAVRAARPWSVSWYFAGLPKKSTLNSTNPNDVNCLTTQSVVHSALSLIASFNSALLSPSLFFARVVMAAMMCGDAATLLKTALWPLGSAGQTHVPFGMGGADCH